MPDTGRPRVVIIGAGFGGLEAAKALRDAAVDVTVIDRQNHHCFQPLLYQVATAALSPADVAWPIRHMLARQRNAMVFMDEVRAIDTQSRHVITDAMRVPYDYLVIAAGAAHSYIGHDEWARFAPGLKGIEDATRTRRRILIAFERAELAQNESERQRLLTFAIVGGGPTGVEMAGAIAEVARDTLPPEFHRIDPRTARILLIEAGPRILPALSEKLSAYAEKTLARMGVEVLTSAAVTNCHARGVEVAGKLVEVGTIVWAAGVVASPVASWIDATTRDVSLSIRIFPCPGCPVCSSLATLPRSAGRRIESSPGSPPLRSKWAGTSAALSPLAFAERCCQVRSATSIKGTWPRSAGAPRSSI